MVTLTQPADSNASRYAWIRRAVLLSWFTIIYNLIEGIVSISFGLGDDSIALAGFGVDSLIEVASAVLVLWRFRAETGESDKPSLERERFATRGIGLLFLGLALFIVVASAFQLKSGTHPKTTMPGLFVSSLSLSFMFYLWTSKKKVAQAIDSKTMAKDADCSRACIQLSSILFLGSTLFLLIPSLWWTDGVAGVLLACFIGKEGWETFEASKKDEFQGGCGCSD